IIKLKDKIILKASGAIAGILNEPFADASILESVIFCRAARQRVKVARGGDGADRLFAGYINFKANRGARVLAAVPGWIGRACRAVLAAIPHGGSYMSIPFLLRQLSQAAGLPPARQWVACMAPFALEDLDRLWRPEIRMLAHA